MNGPGCPVFPLVSLQAKKKTQYIRIAPILCLFMKFRYAVIVSLLVVFTGINNMSYAQTNSLEAKAAYLLAEESYGKGNMRAALDYLNEATAKLGAANAKILYLKIMALKEVSLKSPAFEKQLDTAIAAFEKAPDIDGFNEEKTLEIIKIKLERKQQKNVGDQLEQAILAYQANSGWIIGMRADSLQKLRPDLFIDQPGKYYVYKTALNRSMSLLYHYKNLNLQNLSDLITIKDSLISNHVHYYYNYPNDETASFDKSAQAQVKILEDLKNTFGYVPAPEIKTTEYDKSIGGTLINYTYTWPGKTLKMALTVSHFNPGGKNGSSCILYIYQ